MFAEFLTLSGIIESKLLALYCKTVNLTEFLDLNKR